MPIEVKYGSPGPVFQAAYVAGANASRERQADRLGQVWQQKYVAAQREREQQRQQQFASHEQGLNRQFTLYRDRMAFAQEESLQRERIDASMDEQIMQGLQQGTLVYSPRVQLEIARQEDALTQVLGDDRLTDAQRQAAQGQIRGKLSQLRRRVSMAPPQPSQASTFVAGSDGQPLGEQDIAAMGGAPPQQGYLMGRKPDGTPFILKDYGEEYRAGQAQQQKEQEARERQEYERWKDDREFTYKTGLDAYDRQTQAEEASYKRSAELEEKRDTFVAGRVADAAGQEGATPQQIEAARKQAEEEAVARFGNPVSLAPSASPQAPVADRGINRNSTWQEQLGLAGPDAVPASSPAQGTAPVAQAPPVAQATPDVPIIKGQPDPATLSDGGEYRVMGQDGRLHRARWDAKTQEFVVLDDGGDPNEDDFAPAHEKPYSQAMYPMGFGPGL